MNSDSDQYAMQKKAVTIFASGAGSNAENCIRYFKDHASVAVNLIITNNPDAGVIAVAEKYLIPCIIIRKEEWKNIQHVITVLQQHKTDLIVLAGFLSLVPPELIRAYRHRIINIHPALLPAYGGKGMYGKFVHAAIIKNREKESGITIHEVDEIYDHGKILFQCSFAINDNDDAAAVEKKARALEYQYLPEVVEKLCLSL